jgi:hypothetical protein
MMAPNSGERSLAARSSIDRTMQRIEKLVERETEALRSRVDIDLRESNNGKSQALLELGLVARTLESIPFDAELIQRLKSLHGKLENNRAVLRKHLDAVREIAGVVAGTIQDSEWDGTYSQQGGSGGAYR